MLTDFQNPFSDKLSSKFAIKSLLNITPHLKYVVVLPFEISMSKKIAMVITQKSETGLKQAAMQVSATQNSC